jgi:hypothetical protein
MGSAGGWFQFYSPPSIPTILFSQTSERVIARQLQIYHACFHKLFLVRFFPLRYFLSKKEEFESQFQLQAQVKALR